MRFIAKSIDCRCQNGCSACYEQLTLFRWSIAKETDESSVNYIVVHRGPWAIILLLRVWIDKFYAFVWFIDFYVFILTFSHLLEKKTVFGKEIFFVLNYNCGTLCRNLYFWNFDVFWNICVTPLLEMLFESYVNFSEKQSTII